MEERLLINGGKKLNGSVCVDASKNAFLPILAATVLCDGEICLDNYVHLSDLLCMREILSKLDIDTYLNGKELHIDTRNIKKIGRAHV